MDFNKKRQDIGFTLLELLIVVAIIAILAAIVIIVLDPAETLKKSRDAQRMSDLATIKTALGIYLTSKETPDMGGASCISSGVYAAGDIIYYSYPGLGAITDTTLDGGSGFPTANTVSENNLGMTDGTGWLPVNLDSLSSGSPISNYPTDPVNIIADPGNVSSADLVYRYVCADNLRYEIDAQLESIAHTVENNKLVKDGGNNPNMYEVGTSLQLLGVGTDF